MKGWRRDVLMLVCAALIGLAVDGAMWKWGISPTTWRASALPDYQVVDGGRADLAHITVTNTGNVYGGYPSCFVWGFSAAGEHVASGYAGLPVKLRPRQSWQMTVRVTAEDGFPAREPSQVTSFTAACYET